MFESYHPISLHQHSCTGTDRKGKRSRRSSHSDCSAASPPPEPFHTPPRRTRSSLSDLVVKKISALRSGLGKLGETISPQSDKRHSILHWLQFDTEPHRSFTSEVIGFIKARSSDNLSEPIRTDPSCVAFSPTSDETDPTDDESDTSDDGTDFSNDEVDKEDCESETSYGSSPSPSDCDDTLDELVVEDCEPDTSYNYTPPPSDCDDTSDCESLDVLAETPESLDSIVYIPSYHTTDDSFEPGVPKQYDRNTIRQRPAFRHLLKAPIIAREEYKGPATQTTKKQSRYSVTRKWNAKDHAKFLDSIIMAQKKTQFEKLQEEKRTLRSRRTIHDDFAVVADRTNTDSNKRKAKSPPPTKRKRRRTDGKELQFHATKGRFIKVVQRRERKIIQGYDSAHQALLAVWQPVTMPRDPSDESHTPSLTTTNSTSRSAWPTADPTPVPDPRQEDNFELLKARHNRAHDNSALMAGSSVPNISTRPPITADELRRIQMDDFIQDTHARHDLIVNSIVPLTNQNAVGPNLLRDQCLTTATVGMAQTRMHVDSGRSTWVTENRTATLYWKLLEVEIQTGCRCARWISSPAGAFTFWVYDVERSMYSANSCLCGRWLPGLSQKQWQDVCDSGPYPSRVRRMIEEMRNMIKVVMPLGPVAPTFQHALDHGVTVIPTVNPIRGVIEGLLEQLDADHVTGLIRAGMFDYTLFHRLADTIKTHCAPSRDTTIDAVVEYATSHDGIGGVRRLFDFLRIMRIDIVNYRLKSIRGWLLDTAPYHELPHFEENLIFNGVYMEKSDTQMWIYAASLHIAQRIREDETHLIGACTCNNRTELVIRSIIEGSFMLMMSDWSDSARSDWKTQVYPFDPTPSLMPESWNLEVNRLWHFSKEMHIMAVEATILWAVEAFTYVFQPNVTEAHVKLVVKESLKVLDNARRANPRYLAHLTTPTGQPAAFITLLANLVCFYDGPTSLAIDVLPTTPAETNSLVSTTMQLHAVIVATTAPEHLQYQTAINDIKDLVSRYQQDEFLGARFGKFASKFHAPESDCRLARLPLLSDADIQSQEAAVRAIRRTLDAPNTNREIDEEDVSRWMTTINNMNIDKRHRLTSQYRLKPLADRIHSFNKQLYQVLETHFLVYHKIYLSKGMMWNSGIVTLFEMQQSRARRMLANARNLSKTVQGYVEPVRDELGHMFGPGFGR